MPLDKLSTVLRILDNENRLLERADQKAIALLSILGVFMVFFIVYYRLIPVNPITIALSSIYFAFALLAIVSLIMTVRPRIRVNHEDEAGDGSEVPPPCEPAFFKGICRFPNLSDYRQSLEDMIESEETVIDVYTRQVFSLARINAEKYKYVQRAVYFVIIALATELGIIVYLFINYLGEGVLPPIG